METFLENTLPIEAMFYHDSADYTAHMISFKVSSLNDVSHKNKGD